jgi:hypothetical protein
VKSEVAFLVGNGQPAGACLEKARGVQAFAPRQLKCNLDAVAALGRAGGGGGVIERGNGRIVLRAEALDLLRVRLRCGHERLAFGHSFAEQRIVELDCRGRAAFASVVAGDRDRDVTDHTGGGYLVGGEAGVAGLRKSQRNLAFGCLGKGEDPLGERFGLVGSPAHL